VLGLDANVLLGYDTNMRAELIIAEVRTVFDDGSFTEVVVWRVPEPVPPSKHAFKYSLVYIVEGVRVLGFDNERGKEDHKHEDGTETKYDFSSIDTVLEDFAMAVDIGDRRMSKMQIEVGRSFRETMAEVAGAWNAAARGESITSINKVAFVSEEAFRSVLTTKRLELLRHLRKSPEAGFRPLARALGRDPSTVHGDVVALSELGLVTKAPNGRLSTNVDDITSVASIAA